MNAARWRAADLDIEPRKVNVIHGDRLKKVDSAARELKTACFQTASASNSKIAHAFICSDFLVRQIKACHSSTKTTFDKVAGLRTERQLNYIANGRTGVRVS